MNKKILIADSGSTKTDWCVVEQGHMVSCIRTAGINPFFQSEEEIAQEIRSKLLPSLNGVDIASVAFYGAGCAFPDKNEAVRAAIARYVPVEVEVGSDLLGAARALCGKEAGIACILGTGSNSCQYDGTEIVHQISPLGFILGDEGSGAVLGKLLVGDLLKNQLPSHLKTDFISTYGLSPADVLDKVYRQPFPNRFLAGLSPFLYRHKQEPLIQQLIRDSFSSFFRRNVMQYAYRDYPAHFVGSIAWYYRPLLEEAAHACGIRIGKIIQSPLEGLQAYHTDAFME